MLLKESGPAALERKKHDWIEKNVFKDNSIFIELPHQPFPAALERKRHDWNDKMNTKKKFAFSELPSRTGPSGPMVWEILNFKISNSNNENNNKIKKPYFK